MRTLAIVLATAGGAGYVPVAPGTAGSLVALPLLAVLRDRAPVAYGVLLLALVAVAVWAAGRAQVIFGEHDPSRVVIDEVAGMTVAGLLLPGTWSAAAMAFVAFRVLDVVKPLPAGLIERRVAGGLGVVGDDLVAGLYAGIVVRLVLAVT